MDNLTHTLFALTMARTPLARAGRGTTAALVLASNAPDIDIVATAGGAMSYLHWHRGPTHGPIGVVVLSVLSAAIAWIGCRRISRLKPRSEDPPLASFAMLVAVSVIGVALHVLMDLPTSYGTRVLSPFTWRWYAIDLMPIVDIYLLVTLLAGIVFGQQSPAARRRNAGIVLTLMAANYGVRAVSHHQALTLVPRLFGPTLPRPCSAQPADASVIESWPRTTPPGAIDAHGRRCLVEVAAVPTFTSPFRWRIIAQFSNAYEIHDIDLLDERFREPGSEAEAFWRQTIRYPNVWTPAVQQAAKTELGQVFLGFSRFPAARSVVDANGVATVRWTDVRFTMGGIRSDQPAAVNPFTALVRIGADGRIVEEKLGR